MVPSAPSNRGNTWQPAAGYTCPQTVRGLLGGTEGRNVNFEEVAADALLPGQLSCTLPWPDFPPLLSLWVCKGAPFLAFVCSFPAARFSVCKPLPK